VAVSVAEDTAPGIPVWCYYEGTGGNGKECDTKTI